VRLRKKQARPAELLGNLDECSVQVRAAEYLPLNRETDTRIDLQPQTNPASEMR
jgi:hypothetical protein